MTENLSPDTLVDASLKSAADGGGTVESSAIKLEDLNKLLGSSFKDPSTALQSLKETKDFVGKRKEDIAAEVKASLIPAMQPDNSLKEQVQALQERAFYAENPQYKGYEPIIRKMGTNPAEVVATQEFKTVHEKVKIADEVEQNKSVVASNSRLSQQKSVNDEAVNVANARGSTLDDVATIFARAINADTPQG